MSYHVFSLSTVDDLLAFAGLEISNAEEDGEKPGPSVTEALHLAEVLAEIIESQAGVQAAARMTAAKELRRQVEEATRDE